MKSCVNRSNFAALCAMLILGCSAQAETIRLVPSESYSSSECWIDQNGEISAFLVLAEEGGVGVPYLVSAKCMIKGDYSSQGEAILHHLNTIRLVDSKKSLQRILPGITISDTMHTDQPVPSSESKLYYFRASIERAPAPKKIVYVPLKVSQFSNLNLSFERFLGLSKDDRAKLLEL